MDRAGGIIDNQGSIENSSPFDAINNAGTIKNAGNIVNFSNLNNAASGVITNSGLIANSAGISNSGTIHNSCGATFTNNGVFILFTGNAVEFDCPPTQSTLSIKAQDTKGQELGGVWTVITSLNGTILKSGFTPLLFTSQSGKDYIVSVSNYDGELFHHWQDGVVENTRQITFTDKDSILTAVYDTGDSLRGFSSLTYTGMPEQPDLRINAITIDGSKTLHMWTIIDPQSSDASGTTYKVYAGNYGDLVFDHWNDGNKDRIRTLTISEATTMTAYYKT